MVECLECGSEITGSPATCARCGAPIAAQNSAAADDGTGESSGSVAPAGPGRQAKEMILLQSASWWTIGGGAAVFIGSLLPWISVYVFEGDLFIAPNDPNMFKAVAVGNSISGGARVAAAIFGLILLGLAWALHSTSTRGMLVKLHAYASGIPLIALSLLGITGCVIITAAGWAGFPEADGLKIAGYGIFTLKEKHPILAENGTAGAAHVSFTPNVGLSMIFLGCAAVVIGAIRSVLCVARTRHECQPAEQAVSSAGTSAHPGED